MTSAKPRRILLIRNAYRFDFGGAERFPVHLAGELKRMDYQPLVVSRSEQLLSYAQVAGVERRRGWWWSWQNQTSWRAALFPIYLLWQVLLCGWYLQLLLRLRPDVVHPQSRDDFVAATVAAKLLGKRVIWTDHADLKYIFMNHRVWYKNPVGKLVYAVSKLADTITLVSKSEQQLIQQALGHPLAKATVIYNGVIDEKVVPVDRPSRDTIVFCATSRLVTAKGIGELLTAFKDLRTTNQHLLLWLVGDGPEAEKFKRQAAGDASIVFVGHSDEPLRYVAASDVFVHPSYHEGFSISLVEATMLGRPVVACNVGGNPEIIQNDSNGLLIPPRDSEALQAALARLANDAKQRQRFGAAARAAFVEGFEFSHIVKERFVPLYEKA
ncbi:MAG TPA: glycosyltransferase family 4 protein [Candidatus Saccharimonadales bacterium]|nr:glycosyltransferase family 4 protein [Candidatus Saccharimonadales bacterium]